MSSRSRRIRILHPAAPTTFSNEKEEEDKKKTTKNPTTKNRLHVKNFLENTFPVNYFRGDPLPTYTRVFLEM